MLEVGQRHWLQGHPGMTRGMTFSLWTPEFLAVAGGRGLVSSFQKIIKSADFPVYSPWLPICGDLALHGF
jgi:hypothetical protein